jgi:hypothetical protein
MKHALLTLLLLVPGALLAQSQIDPNEITKSGTLYLKNCEASAKGVNNSLTQICRAWLDGVVRGIVAVGYWSNYRLVNIPGDVVEGQIEKVVVKYMHDHPRDVNDSTSLLVLEALIDAYPAPAPVSPPAPKSPRVPASPAKPPLPRN